MISSNSPYINNVWIYSSTNYTFFSPPIFRSKRRKGIVFANTLFKCLTYDAKEVQLVTSGTDRKIGFWETHGEGERIRELDGSISGSVNAIDISPDGRYLVTGGDDRMIKVC